MRVSPIVNFNYETKNLNRHKFASTPAMQSQVSFNGWRGALGAVGGTLLGAGIGALTGGIGAVLLAGITGCAIGGEVCDSFDDHSDDVDGPSAFEFIG